MAREICLPAWFGTGSGWNETEQAYETQSWDLGVDLSISNGEPRIRPYTSTVTIVWDHLYEGDLTGLSLIINIIRNTNLVSDGTQQLADTWNSFSDGPILAGPNTFVLECNGFLDTIQFQSFYLAGFIRLILIDGSDSDGAAFWTNFKGQREY